MKKDLAIMQLIGTLIFKQLFKRELKSKLELPYCDDSYLKMNDNHETINQSTNELEGKKVD